jgi:hypothetical protein
MFILNGQPLSPDVAFTHDGIQYPANWLRLSSSEEREAIGITEEPDPIQVDQRFYWDTGIPKDHAELVKVWVAQVKETAGSLLSQTDWYITRASETGLAAPQGVLTRRAEVRTLSNDKEALLGATTTTDELAAYVTSADYSSWSEKDTTTTAATYIPGGSSSDQLIV